MYTTLTKPEKDEEHYFSVQLDGVDTNSRLLSYADVEDYLTQNAPVPYSPDFVWGKEIVKRLQNEGLTISSYNISLEYGTRVATLYKPYRDEFIVDKGKNITDVVQDIQVVKIPNDRETLTAIGWLAKTSYKCVTPLFSMRLMISLRSTFLRAMQRSSASLKPNGRLCGL